MRPYRLVLHRRIRRFVRSHFLFSPFVQILSMVMLELKMKLTQTLSLNSVATLMKMMLRMHLRQKLLWNQLQKHRRGVVMRAQRIVLKRSIFLLHEENGRLSAEATGQILV
ncbi:uncharacterized protein LOC118489160 [Helianthus annuus]|uniref:uncharacterized protein LOC118489160 n=1 Tax=Helianthus annuus TaxID=4232 RepID=UPI00165310F7|nr:uncharacterized protein LOC118489160 [Helianthus annuus]